MIRGYVEMFLWFMGAVTIAMLTLCAGCYAIICGWITTDWY